MFILFFRYVNIYEINDNKLLRTVNMANPDKNENNSFNYESKIESLSFLKDLAAVFAKPAAIIYIILVLLFTFAEQGINKTVVLAPLLIFSAVFFIIFLLFFMLFIWEALFSPYKIYVRNNYITCKFFYRKTVSINIDDILFIKRHKGYSKTRGTYYKNKYTLLLKNGKKFLINCFIFKNSSDLNFFFTDITRLYNKKYIKYVQNEKDSFSDIYSENKYCFHVFHDSIMILITLCLLFFLIFFISNKMFFPAIIVFAILAAIPAVPVKIIMNISEETVILKSVCGIKTHRISYYDTKQIVITNNLDISVTAIFIEKKKKKKTFSLSFYKSQDRDKIFKILNIIFKDEVLFNLNGDEALITDKIIK